MQVSPKAIFGVGAPEAVLVGVVALVVFGPKGLAEARPSSCLSSSICPYLRHAGCMKAHSGVALQAVKSLGKTLKTFQPTIREVMSVSSELRNTLEEQIGLDDIRSELRSSVTGDARPTARNLTDLVRGSLCMQLSKHFAPFTCKMTDSYEGWHQLSSMRAGRGWKGQREARCGKCGAAGRGQ